MYENLVPVGAPRGDDTNTDRASNQLVQFFLRKFFERKPELFPRGSGGAREFLLDGKVGPQTIEGIRRFQLSRRQGGIPVLVDARVSVAQGITIDSAGNRWTIHLLNSDFLVLSSTEEEFNSLFLHPEINSEAPELASELAREEQLLRS